MVHPTLTFLTTLLINGTACDILLSRLSEEHLWNVIYLFIAIHAALFSILVWSQLAKLYLPLALLALLWAFPFLDSFHNRLLNQLTHFLFGVPEFYFGMWNDSLVYDSRLIEVRTDCPISHCSLCKFHGALMNSSSCTIFFFEGILSVFSSDYHRREWPRMIDTLGVNV
jgi:hypothetical protein